MYRFLPLLTVMLAAPAVCSAQAGEIRLGAPEISGGTVKVPVSLDGNVGEGAAAMDFRFRYDPSVFEPVSIQAGAAASAAQKLVQANVVRPGEYVVLVFGLNQETVAAGEIANITLRRLDETATGASELRIANTTISLPNATDLASSGSTVTVDFGAPPTENPPPDPGESPPEAPETPPPAEPETPQSPPGSPGGTPPLPSKGQPASAGVVDSSAQAATSLPTARPVPGEGSGRQLAQADALRAELPRGGAEAVDKERANAKTAQPSPRAGVKDARPSDAAAIRGDGSAADAATRSANPSPESEEQPAADQPPAASSSPGGASRLIAIGAGVAVLAALLGIRKFLFR
jgi:hypothetical protein